MRSPGPLLERLGGLEVLSRTDLIGGEARFLTRYFLPEHGRYRWRACIAALARLQGIDSACGLALRGRLQRLLGRDQEARLDWAAALKRQARCAQALAFRGEERTARQPQAALLDLERALSLEPSYWPALLWRAQALACLGRHEQAISALDGLMMRRPFRASAGLLRGLLRERVEDFRGAQADYSAVLSCDPGSAGLYTLRAGVRCKMGDLSGAVADADKGILLHPENLDGYVRILYWVAGVKAAMDPSSERDILLGAARRLLAEDPRRAWAHAVEAGILGRSDLQLEGLRRAVRLDPGNAWMRAFLGRALAAGQRELTLKGLRQLTLAVRQAPGAGWIRCWRAEVRRQLGDAKGARADLDKGLSLDPDYRLGFAWRAFLRDLRGDSKGAVCDMTRCLEALPRTSFLHLRAQMRGRAGDWAGALEDIFSCMAESTPHALAYGGARWLTLLPKPGARAAAPRFLTKSPLEVIEIPEARSQALRRRGASAKALGLLWLARLRLDAAQARQALVLLRQVREPQGHCFLIRSWSGEALCRMGLFRQAQAELDRALRLKPGFLPSLLWRAACLDGRGRRAAALKAALRACEAEPQAAWAVCAWLKRQRPGLLRSCRGDGAAELCALAELELRSAAAWRGGSLLRGLPLRRIAARGLLVRGLAEAQGGAWPQAERDLLWAARHHRRQTARLLPLLLKGLPDLGRQASILAYASLAEAQRALEGYGQSQRLLSTIRGLSLAAGRTSSGLILSYKSEALRLQGDLGAARKTAQSAVRKWPGCAQGWSALGKALRQGGESRAALKVFERALRLDPSDGSARAWQAEVMGKLGLEAGAALAARRAQRAGQRWALAVRAQMESRKGNETKAWDMLKAVFAADPAAMALADILGAEPEPVRRDASYAWLYAWRGLLRRRQGRWQEAEADFGQALSLDPGCFWALACRGECRLAAGKTDAARSDLDEAIRACPAFADALVWRARLLHEQGDFLAALRDFLGVLDAAADNVWALAGAGVCLEKLGRPAQAKKYLLKAKRLAPGLFVS